MHFLNSLIPKKSFLLCKNQWPTVEIEVFLCTEAYFCVQEHSTNTTNSTLFGRHRYGGTLPSEISFFFILAVVLTGKLPVCVFHTWTGERADCF